MKNAVSYLLFSAFLIIFLTTSVGFGIHVCSKDRTTKPMLLTQKMPCSCHQNEEGVQNDDSDSCCGPSCCGSFCEPDEAGNPCCHTVVYILENEINIVDCMQVEAPTDVLALVIPIISNEYSVPCETAIIAFHTVDIVFGPDGGLDSITPLRL